MSHATPAPYARASTAAHWARRMAALVGSASLVVVIASYAGPLTTPAAASVTPRPVTVTIQPTSATTAVTTVTVAPPPVAPVTTAPSVIVAAVRPATVARVLAVDDCAVAMAYLAAHAAPGFAHFCRPGSLVTTMGATAAYTCVPGAGFSCPDSVAEIIISDPGCAASYKNEASNSHWDFSGAGVIAPGSVQDGRTWDPFGACSS